MSELALVVFVQLTLNQPAPTFVSLTVDESQWIYQAVSAELNFCNRTNRSNVPTAND